MAEYIIDKIAYGGNVYKLQDNQSGYITVETDPVFSASPAAGISAADISNWNGKSDTDEKLKTDTNYSLSYSYKILFGSSSSSPSTKFYSQNLEYSESDSTATIRLGGSTKLAQLMLASGNNHTITLYPDSNMTSDPYIQLPDKTGTIALTSDVPSISLNGSSTTSASFYAPTSAGTSGYVLVSSGNGAPTWASIPAGATVTLNGIVSATPSFYAPTTAGTSGQVLTSNGSGAPTWTAAGGSSTQIIRWTES